MHNHDESITDGVSGGCAKGLWHARNVGQGRATVIAYARLFIP